jgi:hypothetical protein
MAGSISLALVSASFSSIDLRNFPPFPPSLEIRKNGGFPHSHSVDDELSYLIYKVKPKNLTSRRSRNRAILFRSYFRFSAAWPREKKIRFAVTAKITLPRKIHQITVQVRQSAGGVLV